MTSRTHMYMWDKNLEYTAKYLILVQVPKETRSQVADFTPI